MKNKEFIVFGLGRFGKSVAITLAEYGCSVLAVDTDEEAINDVLDVVTRAVKADVMDPEVMKNLGLHNFDGAIIAIGESLEASVLATISAKECGVQFVLAKACNAMHGKILKKVGADMVVFPEKESGIRIAHNIMNGNPFDSIGLSEIYSIMDIFVKDEWIGKSLMQLKMREKYKINVIGIKRDGKFEPVIDASVILNDGDELTVIGDNKQLDKMTKIKTDKGKSDSKKRTNKK